MNGFSFIIVCLIVAIWYSATMKILKSQYEKYTPMQRFWRFTMNSLRPIAPQKPAGASPIALQTL